MFKKDVADFLDKNKILYKKGTPERQYQDLRKFKSQFKVKPEPGYNSGNKRPRPSKRQLDLF